MNILEIVGRNDRLMQADLASFGKELDTIVRSSRFLVLGAAGSIGQEVVKQIFRRNPRVLHCVDISENNLTELTRDLRSGMGYTDGETEFFAIDMTGPEFEPFMEAYGDYDYVLNLAALKHVRSDKHAFTLMRMIRTNVIATDLSARLAAARGASKYFAVSSDKAKNPANLMGSTKSIMEDVLFTNRYSIPCSTARFANVAFSDGSLLHGWRQRLRKRQPITAPSDIERYFIIPEEAGELCLFSALLGGHREVFFPKDPKEIKLTGFPEIARRFLEAEGYEAVEVETEDEARSRVEELAAQKKWPCLFFETDTSGEKPFEEFYADDDIIDWDRFRGIGVVKWSRDEDEAYERTQSFIRRYHEINASSHWGRAEIVEMIRAAAPDLSYVDTGKFLDSKM
ncbi:MAG: NAD-dependent epimerase/dehydratase family protein [Alphaproteobacteria bacterium]|nr:MAG: NAD-dependent epimerase/dehydratase family protein [Alphaproteobacteria bacterium]